MQYFVGNYSQRTLEPMLLHPVQRQRGIFGGTRSSTPRPCARRVLPTMRVAVQQVSAEQQDKQSLSAAAQADAIPVRFTLQKELPFGQSHVLVGSHPSLGAWNVRQALQMSWGEDHIWAADVPLPPGTSVEFKCVRVIANQEGAEEWEVGENHVLSVPGHGVASVAVAVEWGGATNVTAEPVPASAAKAALAPKELERAAGKVEAKPAPEPAAHAAHAAQASALAQPPAAPAKAPQEAKAAPAVSAPAPAAVKAEKVEEPAPVAPAAGQASAGESTAGIVVTGLAAAVVGAYFVAAALYPEQLAAWEAALMQYASQLRQAQ